MSEFGGIRLYVALDWFVNDFCLKTGKYLLTGDGGKIALAYQAAYKGQRLLASVRERIAPLLEMGFELRQEAVPTSVEGAWFNMPFLSLGIESKGLQKTKAVAFILPRLKKMGLESPELSFKLFYLPAFPAATTTEGHHMIAPGGFTNIEKRRIEINLFPPRDFSTIFKNLIHEIVHMCILEKSKHEEPAAVEAEVETYTNSFLSNFSEDWASVEKSVLEDLRGTIDKEFAIFSEANCYLVSIMDRPNSEAVIETLFMLFDAVLNQSVVLEPMT